MASNQQEIKDFAESLRIGAKTLKNLIAAFLIWLFGLLVFLPLASSLNRQIEIICSLIIIIAVTILIFGSIQNIKRIIDKFSVFPAKKFLLPRGFQKIEAQLITKQILYILSSMIGYLFYFPFLTNLHPAINGIVLLLVILLGFFLILRISGPLLKKFSEWIN